MQCQHDVVNIYLIKYTVEGVCTRGHFSLRICKTNHQRWNREHDLRSQGLKKASAAKAKDLVFEAKAKDQLFKAQDQTHNFSKLWSANF